MYLLTGICLLLAWAFALTPPWGIILGIIAFLANLFSKNASEYRLRAFAVALIVGALVWWLWKSLAGAIIGTAIFWIWQLISNTDWDDDQYEDD